MPGFAIYALSTGNGILAISPMPGASGDYLADLEHIREWAPAFVVTLMPRVEQVAAGVETLDADIRDRGARWIHFPIEDFATPDEAASQEWDSISDRLRAVLEGGGRVLLHCRGGCGRSGMLALRLMIELGESPDQAFARLRGVRPCAIETEAQLGWARKAKAKAKRRRRKAART